MAFETTSGSDITSQDFGSQTPSVFELQIPTRQSEATLSGFTFSGPDLTSKNGLFFESVCF